LLGWVVREGVTNVIRHSGGRQCEIEVHSRDGSVTVTVRDDGGGTMAVEPAGQQSSPENTTPRGPSGGHGLKGLRERLAAGGGTLEAGPRPGGGFCLTATVPVQAREGACR
jgi:two-component system sensor histidine kinase DesK